VPTDIAPDASPAQAPCPSSSRSRLEVVGKVLDFEQARSRHISQRQFATAQQVPRTTLQGWLKCKQGLDAAPELIAFFESPVGLAFAHRLVHGAHLIFNQSKNCGIRALCQFFQLVGLGPFLAPSYGVQQKLASQMEQHIVEYEEPERVRLSAQMTPKQICLAEDENFHEKMCLVAVEPVSDFLVVERYAEHRDAANWNQAVTEGLRGLKVNVVQVTSDEALGIASHAEQGLGAHRGPDLFHGQHEISKGTSAALSAKKREAEAAYDEASQQWQQVLVDKQEYEVHPGPGRPPSFAARLERAEQAVQQAQQAICSAKAHKEAMHKVVIDLGAVYPPYDLKTGVATSPAELNTALSALLHKARQVAKRAKLGDKAKKHIDKAARLLPKFVATLAFFHTFLAARVTLHIKTLALPAALEPLLHKVLIPALYLLEAAKKARTAAERHTLEQRAHQLLCTLGAASPWQALEPAVQQSLRNLARQCAQVFQRSSSCVEGRNGQLALGHHHLHRISDRKLRVLTILHNYFIRRPDGTTAAERFFGAPPADLFLTLCDRMPLPARPRKRHKASSAPRSVVAA
jgi:Family of unknown function (DUF6399)